MTARRRAELQADVERAQRWKQTVLNELDDQRAKVARLAIEVGTATDAIHSAEQRLNEEIE